MIISLYYYLFIFHVYYLSTVNYTTSITVFKILYHQHILVVWNIDDWSFTNLAPVVYSNTMILKKSTKISRYIVKVLFLVALISIVTILAMTNELTSVMEANRRNSST